jgi:tetratricopeptide (TPR) repeat protein
MTSAPDPYERYLQDAAALFEAGNVVKAGQIWQAILKRSPGHPIARAGLYKVKVHFDAAATQDGLLVPTAELEDPALKAPELARLLEMGCTLYDSGAREEAVATWEKVQAMDPDNVLARGYIDGARRQMEADAVRQGSQTIGQPEIGPPGLDIPGRQPGTGHDQLLREGCTLFDMGQPEEALGKWMRILAEDPGHALALSYANSARKGLGLPPLQPGAGRRVADLANSAPEAADAGQELRERLDRLVREGVQIYDLGMVEEAVEKWQQVLEAQPEHPDAAGYLEMARRDAAEAERKPSRPVTSAAPAAEAAPELETRLQDAQQLIRSQRFEEAAGVFQALLEHHPGDPRVLQGYHQARALLAAAQEPLESPPAETAGPEPVPAPPPLPVDPPRALTSRAAPQRAGLQVPGAVSGVTIPAWLLVPRNLFIGAGALLLLWVGAALLRGRQREASLRQAVASAKADAMEPVSRQTHIPNLLPTPEAIHKEAEANLADDPLLAYFRAQEWLRQDPGNATAAQLVDQARTRLAAPAPAKSLADFDKDLQAGDLETAEGTIHGLLRQNPDDPDLKTRARKVYLGLAQVYAGKERFGDARDCLLHGRALFPQDKTWAARLKLLESIQTMAKGDRAGWIQLLG